MPDWFLIAFFIVFYTMFVIGMAFIVALCIGHLVNIAWILMRKVFPSLPENRKEYYEQILRDIKDTHAKLFGISDRDKH